MSRRLEFHQILIGILGTKDDEESRVYFQPPSTVKMKYPCIVYRRSRVEAQYADNLMYRNTTCYMVIVIDSNPDSEIPNKVLDLPLCRFDRHYTVDNLNHDVFNVYY